MSEFCRVTPKFSYVLEQLPILSEYGFRGLRGGELLGIRTAEGWRIRSVDDPSRINPRLDTVYLSGGRETGEPDLAFEAIEGLSRILYDTPSDPPAKVRGSVLVAATWYFPEWDWYINRPIFERDSAGIKTTRGMWGQIAGGDFEAEGIVVVCRAIRTPRERLKIQRGGFPGPKDWSPKGRLPGDY